jgi:hypothetical protein
MRRGRTSTRRRSERSDEASRRSTLLLEFGHALVQVFHPSLQTADRPFDSGPSSTSTPLRTRRRKM